MNVYNSFSPKIPCYSLPIVGAGPNGIVIFVGYDFVDVEATSATTSTQSYVIDYGYWWLRVQDNGMLQLGFSRFWSMEATLLAKLT